MEIVNAILKKYVSFSLLDIFSFSLLGIVIFYFFQKPQFLSLLNLSFSVSDINNFPINLFFVIFWILIFLLLKKIREILAGFLLSFKNYNFKSWMWPYYWEYQGNARLWKEDDTLYVTDTNSGCILKGYYWKNFEMTFSCKFPEGVDNQIIGIIFRAKNLSDYLMVQINNEKNIITPHIRMEGIWETIEGPWSFAHLERNKYFKVKLKVLHTIVKLFINDTKILDWVIPSNSDIKLDKKDKDSTENSFVPRIDFRTIYGKIGFRAYYDEGAIIKKLFVKRIPSFL